MRKYLLLLIVSTISLYGGFSFSCGKAPPVNKSNFCAKFKEIAGCQCTNHLQPDSVCSDMKKIYSTMLKTYKTLSTACLYAASTQNTTQQECIDDWNCYWLGGTDSTGKLKCSGTGSKCPYP